MLKVIVTKSKLLQKWSFRAIYSYHNNLITSQYCNQSTVLFMKYSTNTTQHYKGHLEDYLGIVDWISMYIYIPYVSIAG